MLCCAMYITLFCKDPDGGQFYLSERPVKCLQHFLACFIS